MYEQEDNSPWRRVNSRLFIATFLIGIGSITSFGRWSMYCYESVTNENKFNGFDDYTSAIIDIVFGIGCIVFCVVIVYVLAHYLGREEEYQREEPERRKRVERSREEIKRIEKEIGRKITE